MFSSVANRESFTEFEEEHDTVNLLSASLYTKHCAKVFVCSILHFV